jgi:NAD(P)-dependent dehydrogenase (short-subunit alcohol dehydrogenase family)
MDSVFNPFFSRRSRVREVLITGASSGIGQATAQFFSEKGWFVYLLGRNEKKLLNTQQNLKNKSEILAYDISHSVQCEKLGAHLSKLNSNLTVLVNNAGIYRPNLFVNEKQSDWLEQFETNLFGAVRLTRLVWPQLLKNKGAVVNVSSTLGIRPIENTGAYSASKAALNSWTQTLALEAGPLGIRVNAICPGLVDTPIHSFHQGDSSPQYVELRQKLDKMQPLGRMGQPLDIAKAIYFVASEDSPWMTGSLVSVDGGISLTTRDP